MKRRVLALILMMVLALVILPTSVFSEKTVNEKRYELPYYETYIKVSNVVSDNSNDYISTIKFEIDDGVIVERQIVKDLHIEATAPCKVTYGVGKQYVHYAKKLEDGSFECDYERQIKFDVEKYYLYKYDENSDVITVDTKNEVSYNDSRGSVGGEGNYVTLGEGTYIVSNYSPNLGHGGGRAFADYNVILTVKGNTPVYAPAIPTASKVLVNKVEKAFDAYNIKGNNYFKLRDLAFSLKGTNKQFEVTWDGTKNAINLVSNSKYTVVGGEMAISKNPKTQNALLSTSKIYVDGKEVALTAYNINGNNYFKLRDIAKAFNIGVTWNGTTNTIGIDTNINYAE